MLAGVKRSADHATVLPDGLELVPHGLLVDAFRVAGALGLTRAEIKAVRGVDAVRDVIAELRGAGYELHMHRSRVDGRPWRYVLHREPLVVVPDPPVKPSPQLRLLEGGGEAS